MFSEVDIVKHSMLVRVRDKSQNTFCQALSRDSMDWCPRTLLSLPSHLTLPRLAPGRPSLPSTLSSPASPPLTTHHLPALARPRISRIS